MKQEVNAALEFLLRLIKQRGTVDDSKAERFADKLRATLHERYAHHWYPANPSKGQAYRCIRVNRSQPCDESLLQACRETGLHPCELGLPRELTLWIDPGEISARSGEKCQHFTVAHFEEEGEGEGEREGGVEDAAQNPSPDQKPDCTEQQTSDYHSATSSDCSSDNEAGEREQEEEGGPSETPTAPPRAPPPRSSKHKEYFYHPAPVWPRYKRKAPLWLSTTFQPGGPLLGYYILPQTLSYTPTAQFIIPQAVLQPSGAAKG
ncbi:Protein BTG3 [Acipenser ruthenus]|uniref:Protein BTG3 n=1 Tax=Acipenser ruthenus TaxID=7906 RepID=A0A444V4U9_ACIRT|nr:Protein BTG3 [Acipenser ruthenus]